jgi:hypothetical protein
MSRNLHLALVLIVATGIAAAGSHAVASWLKIKTAAAEPFVLGNPTGKPPAFMAASSVGGYGILWGDIATRLDTQIKTWGIAGGSPIEFEQFQKKVPEAQTTFIVISTYDLDEALPCDFRAAIVPIGQACASLWEEHADWRYSKLVLSQYPMTWLRTPFPTLGRSRGLMGAALIRFKDLAKQSPGGSQGPVGPTIKFGKGAANDEYTRQRLSDWSHSAAIGKLVAMRVEFQGEHSFDGAKKRALERMLQYAGPRGRAFIVVLPISAAYTKEFISPELVQKFEAVLAEVQRSAPRAEIVRLDRVPGLGSDENYCDLVHMNVFGQKLATEALLAQFPQPAHQP